MIWIDQAKSMGGVMNTLHGYNRVTCIMRWSGVPGSVNGYGDTLEEAMQDLDRELMEDCAKEMCDKGAA